MSELKAKKVWSRAGVDFPRNQPFAQESENPTSTIYLHKNYNSMLDR